ALLLRAFSHPLLCRRFTAAFPGASRFSGRLCGFLLSAACGFPGPSALARARRFSRASTRTRPRATARATCRLSCRAFSGLGSPLHLPYLGPAAHFVVWHPHPTIVEVVLHVSPAPRGEDPGVKRTSPPRPRPAWRRREDDPR